MSRPAEITLLLGVDRAHLTELALTWPDWLRWKRELLAMPMVVFFDSEELRSTELGLFSIHPMVRLVPWRFPSARDQREEMLTGFIHVAARDVTTPWYLKLDTDAVATGPGEWLRRDWFTPNAAGQLPVYIAPRWSYTKPANALARLDEWADGIPELAQFPRLDVPFDPRARRVPHRRAISWFFLGQTEWTRRVRGWLKGDGRLPVPSQDTLLSYCASRGRYHFVHLKMDDTGWKHQRSKQMMATLAKTKMTLTPLPVSGRIEAKQGVIYYHTRTSCAVRLLVSLFSLRRHYSGPVTILSVGDESHPYAARIASQLGAEVRTWEPNVPPGKNAILLAKTRLHEATPYEVSVMLDTDTLVIGPIDDLFEAGAKGGFAVARMGQWTTDKTRMRARITAWRSWMPDLIDAALAFGPAINTGVIAFRRDTPLFRDWFRKALPGRENFIADETSCQVLLPQYPHVVLDGRWNCSCLHDDPSSPETRIIHYHGRKHCRPGLRYNGARWVAVFDELVAKNIANVREWSPAGDRMLKRFLRWRRAQTKVGRARQELVRCVATAQPLRVILGANKTSQSGWISTDRDTLDVTCEEDWCIIFGDRTVDSLLAEHVWEHLSPVEAKQGAEKCFRFLAPGGRFRLAVPDGFHPDLAYIEYVRPGGIGKGAHNHKILYNYRTLSALLEAVGFRVELLEYWNESGKFSMTYWNRGDGSISRSFRFDRRNRDKRPNYTSVIVDAWKPNLSSA